MHARGLENFTTQRKRVCIDQSPFISSRACNGAVSPTRRSTEDKDGFTSWIFNLPFMQFSAAFIDGQTSLCWERKRERERESSRLWMELFPFEFSLYFTKTSKNMSRCDVVQSHDDLHAPRRMVFSYAFIINSIRSIGTNSIRQVKIISL